MAKPKAPKDRYAVVDGKKVEFGSLKKGDLFELYESDHTQVGGKLIALSDAHLNDSKVWGIMAVPYMELKIREDRVKKAEAELKDAKAELKAFKEKKHV